MLHLKELCEKHQRIIPLVMKAQWEDKKRRDSLNRYSKAGKNLPLKILNATIRERSRILSNVAYGGSFGEFHCRACYLVTVERWTGRRDIFEHYGLPSSMEECSANHGEVVSSTLAGTTK